MSPTDLGLVIGFSTLALAVFAAFTTNRGRAAVSRLIAGSSVEQVTQVSANRAQEMEAYANILKAELDHSREKADAKIRALEAENESLKARQSMLEDMVKGTKEIQALTTAVQTNHELAMTALSKIAERVGVAL